MLTPERHRCILKLLKEDGTVTVKDLAEETNSSESTIRRDLIQLEEEGKLVRFHGGAESINAKAEEKPVADRLTQHLEEKQAIGKKAAEQVNKGDCIYLDAGTTTSHLIEALPDGVIIVTNGISLVEQCLERGFETYLLGGHVKGMTRAMIGKGALDSLKNYRFDKCFMGMNGIHPKHGLTTPDPEEALIKRTAMELSEEIFVLADASKFGKVSFSFVYPLDQLTIITNGEDHLEYLQEYQKHKTIEVVTT